MNETLPSPLDPDLCRRACVARDPRFDGLFFLAVTTTGIFCRPVCPARPPRAGNARYFPSAEAAIGAGFRPCRRCRPEAAPGSPAWRGVQTTLQRALQLIDAGEWRGQSIAEFAARLGVGDRHLRALFRRELGIAPLAYANYRRALLAHRLLRDTALPVPEVAALAGFGSARRCAVACARALGATPRGLRRGGGAAAEGLRLLLHYRPPYCWPALRDFLAARAIAGVESVTETSYGRSFRVSGVRGAFVADHCPQRNGFRVQLWLERPVPIAPAVAKIRALLDLDTDPHAVAERLARHPLLSGIGQPGLRLPGVWEPFEAGVRAVLGQQVSVEVAHRLVAELVARCGLSWRPPGAALPIDRLFPEPAAVLGADLGFLRITGQRRAALHGLARHLASGGADPAGWSAIPGIGPWTRDYAALRLGHPDILLESDLGVRRALQSLQRRSPQAPPLSVEDCRPWGSYATLLLWQLPGSFLETN